MDGALDGLNSLDLLFLGNNAELKLDENTFGSNRFASLSELRLNGCNLKSLPVGLLKDMT